ncbi:hypothetical protein [Nocardioides bruguierae]|uniref:Heparin-binding hemagglutinin n=1 Tax=Nocardioides bruguierae TaxID=2945102 RepID=A0A9X2D9K9_9ACTN|nr:hypothetical protein [Nocardioides bruguierae]MCM0621851.1 hypothetical protein [Nocardioides bruguierae]
MAKFPTIDLKDLDLKAEATKTLYAGVGVLDLAVETVRGYVTPYVTEGQKKLAEGQKKFTDLKGDAESKLGDAQKSVSDLDPADLREQAMSVVNNQVETLTAEAKARREQIEKRVADLQTDAKAFPGKVQTFVDDSAAAATAVYGDFAKRGQVLVERIRTQDSTQEAVKDAKTTTAKAKTTATQAKKAASTTKKAASSNTKAATTTTKKTAAKKAPAKKAPATKKAAAAKTAAKSTTSTGTSTAKTAAKKTTTTAKKASAPATSSAKATTTAATKTAEAATTAATEAAKKVGD